jgi:hypothetical protein
MKISISAYKAIDNPSISSEFMEGHANVLRDFGISVNKLTSANIAWSKSPESNIIIVRSLETGQLVGGARIDIGGFSLALPIEQAVGQIDSKIYELVKKDAINGTGEVCGVWTSNKVAGRGVAVLLLRAAISLATQLELSSLFVLCSEATLSMFTKMGCIVNKSLGEKGKFYYPKEDLVATALILPDVNTLENADEVNKKSIFDLRLNPQQKKTEVGLKGNLEVEYDLIIPFNPIVKKVKSH